MTLTYYTAVRDLLPRGIRAGDTISVDTTNPDEPVMVHYPAVGVTAAMVEEAVAVGCLVPVASGVPVAVGPAILSGGVSSAPVPSARPRLRLLRPDDQQMA